MNQLQQQQLSQHLDQFILCLLLKECVIDNNIVRHAKEIVLLSSVCKRWLNTIKIDLSRLDSKSDFLEFIRLNNRSKVIQEYRRMIEHPQSLCGQPTDFVCRLLPTLVKTVDYLERDRSFATLFTSSIRSLTILNCEEYHNVNKRLLSLPMPSLECLVVQESRKKNPTKYCCFQSLFGTDLILNSPILENVKKLVLFWFVSNKEEEEGVWLKVFKRMTSLESLHIFGSSSNSVQNVTPRCIVTTILSGLVFLPNLIHLDIRQLPKEINFDQLGIDSTFKLPKSLTNIKIDTKIGKTDSFKSLVQQYSKQLKQLHDFHLDQDWIKIFPLTTLTSLTFAIQSVPNRTPIFPPTIEYLNIVEDTDGIPNVIDFNEWKLDQLPRLEKLVFKPCSEQSVKEWIHFFVKLIQGSSSLRILNGELSNKEYIESDFFILFNCISKSPTFKQYTQRMAPWDRNYEIESIFK
ncbi:hypothetical protein DFA_01835 [Cavenderia fasciculata]|uniref:F-box domain-containing protein n=1 Tax=Cavenderia fasciculata TaxID=261658 RepID=F4PUY7_CACFS|nr:uncharacterized protein DFA_01835 [Cavenderia fasciculata]EGG21949.1 hypothetical protein DFA_01835 [Cavenderia fasciculata]|eukprot:XP_004359800.1 hypothetical protein DFA_01835 [Cavenderia fasciculata]